MDIFPILQKDTLFKGSFLELEKVMEQFYLSLVLTVYLGFGGAHWIYMVQC